MIINVTFYALTTVDRTRNIQRTVPCLLLPRGVQVEAQVVVPLQ